MATMATPAASPAAPAYGAGSGYGAGNGTASGPMASSSVTAYTGAAGKVMAGSFAIFAGLAAAVFAL